MSSGARTPPRLHIFNSPHRAVSLGSYPSPSKAGQANYADGESNYSYHHQGQDLINRNKLNTTPNSFRRKQETAKEHDEDGTSYDVVRLYESNDSVLPTYSPSASISALSTDSRLYSPTGTPTRVSHRDKGTHLLASMESGPRRFGAGGFDAYGKQTASAEDAVAEKSRLLEGSDGRLQSGFGSKEKRLPSGGRFANLIPEKRPPRSPVSTTSSDSLETLLTIPLHLLSLTPFGRYARAR
jgi:hypothetical protein